MSSKKSETTWAASPHTIAKIDILEAYLTAYFQILGRTKRGQELLYIDGFAGPGEYTNHPKGSPIAALVAGKVAISSLGQRWIASKLHCAFIEERKDRYDNLVEQVEPFQGTHSLEIHAQQSTFVDGIAELKKQIPAPFEGRYPLFAFIDPFGPTGVPFKAVSEILSSPCSEILINLDADGIGRIFRAQDSANHEILLNEIYGDDSWRSKFAGIAKFDSLCYSVLDLYKSHLRSLPNVKYVFAFEMRSSGQAINYFLVFAGKHPLGLRKMKEAMRKLDQTGEYQFSDAKLHQASLFRFDDPDVYAPRLYQFFQSQQITYGQADDYALNETPFVNPKSMLKILELSNRIKVISNDPKRRRGQFPEGKIESILFL